jgi:hypothetical protein
LTRLKKKTTEAMMKRRPRIMPAMAGAYFIVEAGGVCRVLPSLRQ